MSVPDHRLGARLIGGGCALVLVWGMVGCTADSPEVGSPDRVQGSASSEEQQVQVEESQSQVEQELREAAEAIRPAGFDLADAKGRWVGCGMEATSGVEYSAGATVTDGGTAAVDRVVAIRDALVEAGWELLGETTTPVPSASLQRDGLQLSLFEDRREPGRLSLVVRGDCVRSGRDTDRSMIGETPDVEL